MTDQPTPGSPETQPITPDQTPEPAPEQARTRRTWRSRLRTARAGLVGLVAAGLLVGALGGFVVGRATGDDGRDGRPGSSDAGHGGFDGDHGGGRGRG